MTSTMITTRANKRNNSNNSNRNNTSMCICFTIIMIMTFLIGIILYNNECKYHYMDSCIKNKSIYNKNQHL